MNNAALIGLGVMGSNLALNFSDHGCRLAVYNYTADLVEKFKAEHPEAPVEAFTDLKALTASLERPRRIFIMVTAGAAVDAVIESLLPLLNRGDIVADLGNSHYSDTNRRCRALKDQGIYFAGVGVSGGAEGARHGPAIMAGGSIEAYREIGPILEAAAAKAPQDGRPCCAYLGPEGAGHFVKMVHNGIEYADMQLITESYLILKYLGGFTNAELSDIFLKYSRGRLAGYLMRITADVLYEKKPGSADDLIDLIADEAEQKGTGRWTACTGFELNVPLTLIDAACNARLLSADPVSRAARAKIWESAAAAPLTDSAAREALVKSVENLLYLGKIACYAQGFALYRKASVHFNWHLDLAQIAEIFRAGCIIQAAFLTEIHAACGLSPQPALLTDSDDFSEAIREGLTDLRATVSMALSAGLPLPVSSAAVNYLSALSSPCVGANLIQGLRDYFGAHTFRYKGECAHQHHEWHRRS